MFIINEDKSIYITRGDAALFAVTAVQDGQPYTFQPNDVVRFKVFEKKGCDTVVLQKDFFVNEACASVDIELLRADTKIGEIIHKPKDFWYEVELNPETYPQTIIGYDEEGAKSFRLLPEGKDIVPSEEEDEAAPGIYEKMLRIAGEIQKHGSDAAAASREAVINSTEAKALAQSVRDDADSGVFNGEKGEKGDIGQKGRGYDGYKRLTLVAQGNMSIDMPLVVEIPDLFMCDAVIIKTKAIYKAADAELTVGGIYYGHWNGTRYKKLGGNYQDASTGGWYAYYGPDTAGLEKLSGLGTTTNSNLTYQDRTYVVKVCNGGVLVTNDNDSIGANVATGGNITSGGSNYISVFPYEMFRVDADVGIGDSQHKPEDEIPYEVYVLGRDDSGNVISDEQVQTAVAEYLTENPPAPGKDGKDGVDGKDGADGYTPQKGVDYFDGKDGADGYTPQKGVDYFDGKDGKDGVDGEDGADGYTPQKGVDYFDGKDGADGYTPQKGVDYFDGKDGKDGVDGITPHIGANGNWWIGSTDTGVFASGGSEQLGALAQQVGELQNTANSAATAAAEAKTAAQNASQPGHKHTKSEITDFPTTMTPTAHKHTKSDITDFPTAMTPTAHSHSKSEITDFPTAMTPTAHNQAASTITAGTFAGQVVANASAQTPGTALLRNSKIVSADTTPTNNGEICWTYK